MNCSQADLLIQTALDGRLSSTQRMRLDIHLGHCAACSAVWDEYRCLSQTAGDWARRSGTKGDPDDAFTARVMAQVAASQVTAPPFPLQRAFAWTCLSLLGLAALSFWTGPLLLAHVSLAPTLSPVPDATSFSVSGIGHPLTNAWQDTLGAWRMLTTHPITLPAWVPGALAVTLGLNGAFAWHARRPGREAATR